MAFLFCPVSSRFRLNFSQVLFWGSSTSVSLAFAPQFSASRADNCGRRWFGRFFFSPLFTSPLHCLICEDITTPLEVSRRFYVYQLYGRSSSHRRVLAWSAYRRGRPYGVWSICGDTYVPHLRDTGNPAHMGVPPLRMSGRGLPPWTFTSRYLCAPTWQLFIQPATNDKWVIIYFYSKKERVREARSELVINGEIGYSEYSGVGNEVRLRLKLG